MTTLRKKAVLRKEMDEFTNKMLTEIDNLPSNASETELEPYYEKVDECMRSLLDSIHEYTEKHSGHKIEFTFINYFEDF